MNRLKEALLKSVRGIGLAAYRFPLSVASLVGATMIIFWMIATDSDFPLIIQKGMFTLFIGAVMGLASQFVIERFGMVSKRRILAYGIAIALTFGYFLILLPLPEISSEVTVRTLVAVFALLCITLWIPSHQTKVDFNRIVLIHFKSFFTALLYAVVLAVGMLAIIGTIHILLMTVASDVYAYTMTVIWVLFVPIYYLSLLPRLHATQEEEQKIAKAAGMYPKFLEILISYIAIPLLCAYTVVLLVYFLKIIFTTTWPSGQVGPMVLTYSIAGLIVFVLSSILENQMSLFYRKVFPKVLILLVGMQLISVGIRINAYGITESRYYVALFGSFTLVVAIMLSITPVTKNSRIALLAAGFAVISILPPMDAFTVSRTSQIQRLEAILKEEGMLSEGLLVKKEDASEYTRTEVTSIVQYLQRSSSLTYIKWLPKDFEVYSDFKEVFGFETTYPHYGDANTDYFNAYLKDMYPLPIEGYDVLLNTYISRSRGDKSLDETQRIETSFEVNGSPYFLSVGDDPNGEVVVSILHENEKEVISTSLDSFVNELVEEKSGDTRSLSLEEMSFEVENEGYRLKIIFENINYITGSDIESRFDYGLYVLFGEK